MSEIQQSPTEKQMTVTDRWSGYGHVHIQGTCSPDVTVKDIEQRFFHWYLGGRSAWVAEGRFGCIVHTD